MEFDKINLLEKFAKLPAGDYAVGLIARMNDYEFKIVKFKGDFIWHSHPGTLSEDNRRCVDALRELPARA